MQYHTGLVSIGELITTQNVQGYTFGLSHHCGIYLTQSANGKRLRDSSIGVTLTRTPSCHGIGVGAGISTEVLFHMTLFAGLVIVRISRVWQYPPDARAVLGHIVHIDFLPVHFLSHGEVGMWRTDAVVTSQNGVHQRGGVIMILTLVLQRAIKGQQQTAVLILDIRCVIEMCLYLLLSESTAPDSKVVDQGFLFIAISRSTSDDNGIITHYYLAFLCG